MDYDELGNSISSKNCGPQIKSLPHRLYYFPLEDDYYNGGGNDFCDSLEWNLDDSLLYGMFKFIPDIKPYDSHPD